VRGIVPPSPRKRTGADVEAIRTAAHSRRRLGGLTAIANAIATVGENMTLRRAATLRRVAAGVDRRATCTRLSPTASASIGVLVALESTGSAGRADRVFGRQVAMHVAATNAARARWLLAVDPAVLEREKNDAAWRRTPASRRNVLEKIVESGLKILLQGSLRCSISPSIMRTTPKDRRPRPRCEIRRSRPARP
jgi:elongation factor Ts